MAVTWITPKTNWVDGDRVLNKDYNRIKNNIQYLFENGGDIWSAGITDMGNDRASTDISPYRYAKFNLFEENLENLNNSGPLVLTIGSKKVFYGNGQFIDAEELNRIESATLELYTLMDSINKAKRRLDFRLGTFKEIRI